MILALIIGFWLLIGLYFWGLSHERKRSRREFAEQPRHFAVAHFYDWETRGWL